MTNSVDLSSLGLGGMDTTSLVSSLVSIASQPMNNLSTQQQTIAQATTSISSFSADLSDLKTATMALSDPTSFQAMAATSSNSSIVATASGSPAAGQWSVSVGNIATAQRSLSNGTSSSTTALGLSGNFGISLGNGTSANISIASTDTLNDIANKIASSGLRVQASLMYDGSQYHLLVSGLDTGSANAVSFDESGLAAGTGGFSLGLSTATPLQTANDAHLTVGGIPVTSATNQITNAIPGVTLAITAPTTAPATISVAGDSSGIQTQVQAFVTAYNNAVTDGHLIAGYGSQAGQSTLLQGDQAVRSSLDQMANLIAAPVAGTSGAYNTLGSVGISLNDDGTLAFNTATFASAMQSDPASVSRLFVTDATNGSTGVMGTFGATIDSLTDPVNGAITAELNGFNSSTQRIQSEITDDQQRITAYQTQLQAQFAQMNAALATYKQLGASLTAAFNTNNSSSGSVL
jgi:flagellar hook-associated protein 2